MQQLDIMPSVLPRLGGIINDLSNYLEKPEHYPLVMGCDTITATQGVREGTMDRIFNF